MRAKIIVCLLVLVFINSCANTNFKMNTNRPDIWHGTIETHEIKVGSKVGGRVLNVLAREGEVVKPGQLLVRFDIAELMAQFTQAEARIAQQQAQLDELQNGARAEEIAQAAATTAVAKAVYDAAKNGARAEDIAQMRALVASAEAELSNAKITAQRYEQLFLSGDMSRHESDNARFRHQAFSAKRDAEMKRLEVLLHGNRSEDIRAAVERYRQAQEAEALVRAGARPEAIANLRAQLQEARAKAEELKAQIAEGEVRAPSAARIEAVAVRPGDLVTPNQTIARLLENDQVYVRVFVTEPDLARLRIGQSLAIQLESNPQQKCLGTIEQINAQGEFTPRNVQSRSERNHLVFGVKVKIDNQTNAWKSGMAVDVSLLTSER